MIKYSADSKGNVFAQGSVDATLWPTGVTCPELANMELIDVCTLGDAIDNNYQPLQGIDAENRRDLFLRHVEDPDWHRRKYDGRKAAKLLDSTPEGFEFRLRNHGAYSALYRRTFDGKWSQVDFAAPPLVVNMDAEHLGFCVGYDAIAQAVSETAIPT